MAEPVTFYQHFRGRLVAAGIRHALTSGMACVRYGLQQTTKDTDWIVDPRDLGKLRELLIGLQEQLPPCRVAYRTVFGAPLDEAWMRHGWTCHILIQDDALAAEHHLDFFARPPRVGEWTADSEGTAPRSVVAMMKRTDRDKDWPFVDGLGWQIAEAGGSLAEALLHVQDVRRLRELWDRADRTVRDAAIRRRPLLLRMGTDRDLDRLEGWIRLERLVWQCINRERYGRYQQAWKDFYRRWRSQPDWSWPTAERFVVQHARLIAAAKQHGLVLDPLLGMTRAALLQVAIDRASALSFVPAAEIRTVAPPATEELS